MTIHSRTTGRGYPPHLKVVNWNGHNWRGTEQIGRIVTCEVCGIRSNTRNRNGDAGFIRQHRRCGFFESKK